MLRSTRHRATAAAALSLAATVAGGALASPARAASPVDPPPGSAKVAEFTVQWGYQVYTCTNGTYVGTPSVPYALLEDASGRFVYHSPGPAWQVVSREDSSKVTAARTADSPVPGAIPELLLKVNSHSGSAGLLSRADYIQRLRTSGGTAPTAACKDGQQSWQNYGATYVFWDAP